MSRQALGLVVTTALTLAAIPAGRASVAEAARRQAQATFGGVYRTVHGRPPVPSFVAFSAGGGWASLHGVEAGLELLPGDRIRIRGDRGAVVLRWRSLPGRPAEGRRGRLELTVEGDPHAHLVLEGPSPASLATVRGRFCWQERTGGRGSSGVRTETWTFDGRGGVRMSATESVSSRDHSAAVDTGDVPGHYRVDGHALHALLRAPGLRTFRIHRGRGGRVEALAIGRVRYLPCA